jgi:hypothetical protein
MLYGNKLGNLRVSGCFISTTALSTMILLSARSFVRTRLSRRAGHDSTYVAFKKLLSAKGKGDGMAPNIKSDEQLSDDRTYRGSRRTDNTRRCGGAKRLPTACYLRKLVISILQMTAVDAEDRRARVAPV